MSDGIRSSCSICLGSLKQKDKVSALVCGHIYHHECISKWMAAKKQCPSCRRPVPKNGFVEKLFFDVLASEQIEEGEAEVDYAEVSCQLRAALNFEKEKNERIEKENESLKVSVKSLEKKVVKDKDKNKNEITRLQATVNTLKVSVEETSYLNNQLQIAKDKLKACEFYKALTTHSDSADEKLKEYLRSNGSLHTEKFFELIKAQNRELIEFRRSSTQEMENLRRSKQSLEKSLKDEKKKVHALKSEVLNLRDRGNVATPVNKRLRAVLMSETPAKRKSMGFDDSEVFGEDLSYFQPVSAPGSSKRAELEAEVPSCSKVVKSRSEDRENAEKLPENSDDFSFDIPVPKNIIKRLPAQERPKIPAPSLKRQLPKNSTKSGQEPAVKTARISSFFVRKNSNPTELLICD
uniref:RING-type domain-containing protein n=1 Tax=Caenorhabditis japonica TaxID=281687 RepID=A0A8R1DXT1_CAEJA